MCTFKFRCTEKRSQRRYWSCGRPPPAAPIATPSETSFRPSCEIEGMISKGPFVTLFRSPPAFARSESTGRLHIPEVRFKLAKTKLPVGARTGDTSKVVPEVRRSARPILFPVADTGIRHTVTASPYAAENRMEPLFHCDKRGIRS